VEKWWWIARMRSWKSEGGSRWMFGERGSDIAGNGYLEDTGGVNV
jgi:hypothetical protein